MAENKNKRKKTMQWIFIILAVIVICGCYYYENKYSEEEISQVKASGTIEVQEVQIAPQVGGRLLETFFEESQKVTEGEILVTLSLDGADSDVKRAEAVVSAAKHKLEELNNGYRREDINAARSQYRLRKVRFEQAEKDRKRFNELANEGVISKREAELYVEKAEAEKHAMNIALDTLNKMKSGFRKEDILQAEAGVAQAEAALAKARTVLSYKTITAPADGVILSKNYETGDVVGPGASIATLGKMDDLWIKLYIPSTQLGLVRLGGEADVKVDAYPDKIFKAEVTEVNQKAEYNPRLSLTQSERANMVFWIKVSVHDEEGILKPGMPADVVLK